MVLSGMLCGITWCQAGEEGLLARGLGVSERRAGDVTSSTLGIQIAQSRSYLYTLGPKVNRYSLHTWIPRDMPGLYGFVRTTRLM